jgi:CubicO group peptidase (beta-lactamase class C family)
MDLYPLLDSALSTIVDSWGLPGLAVGITDAGRVLYSRFFGVQSLNTGMPVGGETIFCVTSVGKCFVATAVMQLAERGMLCLDAPVTRYLPYFAMDDARYAAITIRQILCHKSGIPDMDEEAYELFLTAPEYDSDAPRRYVASLRGKKLDFPPGERFSYSNTGYNVLGAVIAAVSGMTFEDTMRESVLLPAGMPDSTFYYPEIDTARLAVPHILAPAMAVRPAYPYHRADAPASFLHATLADMLSWCRAGINKGEIHGQRLLSAAGYEQMWTPAAEWGFPPLYESMGLGWTLGHYKGAATASHGGMGMGWADFITILPDKQFAAVLLCNAGLQARGRVIRALLDTILGFEPVPGTVSWIVPLAGAYRDGGIPAVRDAYEALRTDSGYTFDPDELTDLAMQLRAAGNERAVPEILSFNLCVHPGHEESLRMLKQWEG